MFTWKKEAENIKIYFVYKFSRCLQGMKLGILEVRKFAYTTNHGYRVKKLSTNAKKAVEKKRYVTQDC